MKRGMLFSLIALAGVLAAGSPVLAEPSVRASTQELAAQSSRPRITIYPRRVAPGPRATRQCRAWLVQEYRVSGPVIVPRQQCWWQ
jgi:hypothetical protein